MTSKEFRIVIALGAAAFLFLFALIAFDVQIDLSPNQVQAASYTLSPTFTYTETVPGLLSYQGTLADGNGDPIDGNVAMTFRIYTTTLGGTPLYTETHPAVVVREGDFAVLLGELAPFPDGLFAEPNRYLGLQVDAQAEMAPRQRFASVAFAMEAGHALTATKTAWTGVVGIPAGFADSVDNTDDTVSWSEISAVAGSGSTQVAIGNHTHNSLDAADGDPQAVYVDNDGNVAITHTLAVKGANNIHPSFPDGLDGTVKNIVLGTSGYTVPAGKTLYVFTAYGGSSYIKVGNTAFYFGNANFSSPLVFPAGTTIKSSANPIAITGIEVDASVTVKNIVLGTSGYTVPARKTLYVFTAYGSSSYIKVGNTAFYLGNANFSPPLVFPAGTTIKSSANPIAITGYER